MRPSCPVTGQDGTNHDLLTTLLPLLDPGSNGLRLLRLLGLYRRARRINTANGPLNTIRLLIPVLLDKLLPLGLLAFARLVLAAVIIRVLVHDEAVRDPADEEPPEQVDGLQRREQRKGDVLADPALVLLGDPVELEGPDGAELGEDRVEDL